MKKNKQGIIPTKSHTREISQEERVRNTKIIEVANTLTDGNIMGLNFMFHEVKSILGDSNENYSTYDSLYHDSVKLNNYIKSKQKSSKYFEPSEIVKNVKNIYSHLINHQDEITQLKPNSLWHIDNFIKHFKEIMHSDFIQTSNREPKENRSKMTRDQMERFYSEKASKARESSKLKEDYAKEQFNLINISKINDAIKHIQQNETEFITEGQKK
jgi:hypothetical protein